ncbi:unnamed protein product [Alopecurus aequalis]
MGKEMENGAAADAVDVSAVGTLVWIRRPNGSWWPGRVVSPHEVPDSCPPPPRSPATPILLLGRRDGPVFVDWCNLERCKRVKPFRCGEPALEDLIRKAQEQQAARRRDQRVCPGISRYARKEDAVLQALDIERARLRLRSSSRPTATATAKPSHPVPAPATTAVPSTRKRRTPNDCEDDAPQRMKDLTDIGAPKKITPSAATFTDLNQHLPATSQMKRSKKSHHDSTAKAKQPWLTADQDQPCGALRKRDRSRPLSELCNGDNPWKNRLKPRNGQRANQQFMRAASNLDTVMVRTSSRRAALPVVKAEPVDDAFPCGSVGPVDAHLAARSLLKADHLYVHQPSASAKAPTWESTKRTSNCSKDGGIPSQCNSRNSKKKTTSSVAHEGGKRIKIEPGCEEPEERAAKHKAASNGVVLLEKRVGKTTAAAGKTAAYKERAAKHKAASNGVVLLEKRVEKTTVAADKTAAYKDLAVIPNGLNRAGGVLQHHSVRRCKLEEPSETISNLSTRGNVSAPSVVFELPPHQVVPPQHRDPAAARCLPAVKPVKTLQLNSPPIYNVAVSAQGAGSSSSSKGGRVPLVSLMSKSGRRPVVGYPVSVEVLDTAPRPPAPSINDNRPSTSNNTTNRPMKEEKDEEPAAAAPRRAAPRPPPPSSSSHRAPRVPRAKAKSRRKASDDDESWRPHTKNSDLAVAAASPRKIRRLSSLAPSKRGVGGSGGRTAAVGELSRGRGAPALACVPLRLVFSRIHEALAR